ncbi:hypothetical protein BH18ACT11_BH18ACT11_15530 [soil metagenome]
MRTARRFVKDESGITLALAIMMILLLGVMGAGLLTFVSRDLNIVVEENKGQRAFEVADAGIEAAKRQLASGVDWTKYDDASPSDNVQWAKTRGGLTLNDLDGDATTPDSVTVTIQHNGTAGESDEFMRVVSTGTYGTANGTAKRRIEAIFEGVDLANFGEGGYPVVYTKSNIKIKSLASPAAACKSVKLQEVSMFSQKNILIEQHPNCPGSGTTPVQRFQNDYDTNGGVFDKGPNDALCNWNSWVPGPNVNQCFTPALGGKTKWNTQSRTIDSPGLAAEGKICSVSHLSTLGYCPSGSQSIADGVRGFDSTTNPRFEAKECLPDAPCPDFNVPGTISYPFPTPRPKPYGFRNAAQTRFTGNPTSSNLGFAANANFGLTNDDTKITFIDARGAAAGNQEFTFNPSGGLSKGILVVWCGRVVLDHSFQGIILSLEGDDLPALTNLANPSQSIPATPGCDNTQPGQEEVGTFRNAGNASNGNNFCKCWVYADGGTDSLAGVELMPDSRIQFRPSSTFSFNDELFASPPPTQFVLEGWRELYS